VGKKMKTIIEIKNLEASYPPLKVLHGVDMEIKDKDIIAIIGPNGAGKSTVLKAIIGMVNIDAGTISYGGKLLGKAKISKLIKLGIGYVPQGRIVFPSLTVKENLEMGGFTLDSKLINERIKEIYELFPALKKKEKQLAGMLSGGQQQMLAIGRALMTRPKVLLMDEPSLGLDPKTMREIFEKIKKVNKSGIAIIMVEQNAHLALEICTRCYILEQGRVALEGDKNLLHDKRVKELYLGGK
jgi:branched-chain amino acid transport system ATP-binding protein